MKVAGVYSFNNGEEAVSKQYPDLYQEIKEVISSVDASQCKTKISEEKTMPGQLLYSPVSLNNCFKNNLYPRGWQSIKVSCDYPTSYYTKDYNPKN